jgi:1-acyl-sn-glycerol-3-phosphate acyltransferase
MKPPDAFRIFRNRPFVLLWLAQLCSSLGDAVVQVTLMNSVLHAGGHAGEGIAKVLFFFVLPSLLFSPVAGLLSDRFSRQGMMCLSNVLRSLLVFLIPVFVVSSASTSLGHQTHGMIYSFSFLMGVGASFFYPAKQSLLPNLVANEDLQVANALNSGTSTAAILLGSVLTGLCIQHFSMLQVLSFNGLLYLMAAGLMLGIRHSPTKPQAPVSPPSSILANGRFILHYLKTHKNTRRLIVLSIILTLVTASFFNTLTVVSTDYYHLDMAGLSKLKGMLGLGMILGTGVVFLISPYLRSATILTLSFLAVCLSTATAQWVNTYSMAWIWLILIGIANASIVVVIDTLLQKITPDRMRGNVFGLKTGLTSFAFLSTTWMVAEYLSQASPFVVLKGIALLSFAVAFGIFSFDPYFRHFTVRTFISSIFRAFFPMRIIGRKHLPAKGALILAGNHTGWVDSLILQSACRRPIWYITGPTAFELPVIRHIIGYFNVIPLQFGKGLKALDVAVKKLNQAQVICIFPEGRLTTDGSINPFNKGVAYIHKKSHAPLVPFAIHGGFEAWAYNKPFPTFRPITIEFSAPFHDLDSHDKVVTQGLQNQVQVLKTRLEEKGG